MDTTKPLIALMGGRQVEHGMLYQIPNSNRTSHAEHMQGKAKEEYEKRLKHESKMVKARFILRDKREVWNDIAHVVGPGEPIRQYRFIDGHVYEVPLGLVEKVNREGKIMKRGQKLNEDGSTSLHDKAEVIREFVPVSF